VLEENPKSGNGLVWNDKKGKSRIIQRIQDALLEYVKGQETAMMSGRVYKMCLRRKILK
jgi:hypothetical protein